MSTAVQREADKWRLGLYLLLASLAMMFLTAALAFVMVRSNTEGRVTPLPVKIPGTLWIGTYSLAVVSFALHQALVSVRRERQVHMQRWLVGTWVMVAVFLVSQALGLSQLLRLHADSLVPVALGSSRSEPAVAAPAGVVGGAGSNDRRVELPDPRSHGLVFALVALHGLHVLGGLPSLAIVTRRAMAGRYDHEWHAGLSFCGTYWHFLGVMWCVFLITFLCCA